MYSPVTFSLRTDGLQDHLSFERKLDQRFPKFRFGGDEVSNDHSRAGSKQGR